MSEDAPQFPPAGGQLPEEAVPEAVPVAVSAVTEQAVDPLEANSQYINLAPENHINPNAKKAEVSEDSRFKMINPNRAMTIMAEKIYGTFAENYVFGNVPVEKQEYGGEHQRGYGYLQTRVGTTESGTKIHVTRGEFKHYSVEREPYYHEELYEHRDGVEISVSYGTPGEDARTLEWYIPTRGKGQEEKDVPEHITIFAAGANQPLTITRWDPEKRRLDSRFDAALQEMGTLLSERINWAEPNNDEPANPESEFALPKSPDQPPGGRTGLDSETLQQQSTQEGVTLPSSAGSPVDFEASVRRDIDSLPTTSGPN